MPMSSFWNKKEQISKEFQICKVKIKRKFIRRIMHKRKVLFLNVFEFLKRNPNQMKFAKEMKYDFNFFFSYWFVLEQSMCVYSLFRKFWTLLRTRP